jgi:ADP-heptose:LPS heptosyltransferase
MTPQNVLIYRVGQLGDTLVALPAIEAIARKHPDCNLILLTDRHANRPNYVSAWDVLRPNGWINEVIFYEPRDQTVLKQVCQMASLLRRLRQYRFAHVYNLAMRTTARAVQRDKFFFRHVVGTVEYMGMDVMCYPPPVALRGHLPAMMPEWRRLIQRVDAAAPLTGFRLRLTEASRKESMVAWPGLAAVGSACNIALAPGSKMTSKRWPEARFIELGQMLLKQWPQLGIIVVGGGEDTALGDRLCTAWGSGGVNLAGKLSIYASAAVLSCCKLYIGNDTGTMHLAAMTGLPCVAIFSSRDYPGLWEPYGTGHAILRKDMSCSGCMLETCVEREMACLKEISVHDVFEAVRVRLQDALFEMGQVIDVP